MNPTHRRLDSYRERLLQRELAAARSLLAKSGLASLISSASESQHAARDAQLRFEAFGVELAACVGTAARSRTIARYLTAKSEDPRRLSVDLKQLRRGDPDVLDLSVFGERLAHEQDGLECRAEACLALARVSCSRLDPAFAPALIALATSAGRWSRRVEAIRCLAALDAKPAPGGEVHDVLVWLTASNEQRWVQPAAIAALVAIAPATAKRISRERLENPGTGDDFLVRARIVQVVAADRRARWADVVALAHDDPSEHVRITAARCQWDEARLETVARTDPSHRVRASALIRFAKRAPRAASGALERALLGDAHPFVVSVAANESARLGRRSTRRVQRSVLAALATASERMELPAATRNDCANALLELRTRERVGSQLIADLTKVVESTAVGGSRIVRDPRIVGMSDACLAPLLSVVARDDFGLGVDRDREQLVLYRGERPVRSVWRTLFEFLHPAPSKRPGVSHAVARRLRGELRAPPARLSEVTATRVPGERVLSGTSGDWGRDLPRVEDFLALPITRRAVTRLFGSRAETTLSSAPSFAQRLKGFCSIVLHYERYAALRQRSLESNELLTRAAYLEEIQKSTGATVQVVPYAFETEVESEPAQEAHQTNTALALLPLLSMAPMAQPGWLSEHATRGWELVNDAIAAPGGFGLSQLAGYGVLALGAIVARQIVVRREIDQTRGAIPMVLGGWGTRGKSGTERLKAALLQGLGYECLVKTTGCEAMFIHAIPGLPAREIFIYRPYDKPTIWEQRDVLSLAARLGVRAFLWECMALQPELVNLLQLQWMRDDVSTITNAYPDHEDIQGPTGQDVAETISEFMPRSSLAFTTEQQMLPVLKARADSRGTRLIAVSPREAELIGEDLLARFGHAEHPSNIALVAAMARHAGVPDTIAIAEMADHVVSDLGALKTYPTAVRHGRSLSFSNGMGANDRAATLENWHRAHFDARQGAELPHGWILTLVNNRADRPARTDVFAELLVKDISADRHVLIGTNLAGLQRAIERALDEHVRAIAPTNNLPEHDARERARMAGERIRAAFARLQVCGDGVQSLLKHAERLSVTLPALAVVEPLLEPGGAESYELAKEQVVRGLRAAGHLDPASDAVSLIAARRVLRALLRLATHPSEPGTLDRSFADAYRAIFLERVEPLLDPKMSGDAIIDAIATRLPPGASARVMGMQNIKGTGLDFVYRWVSLETVSRSCEHLQSADPAARESALIALVVHQDYGVIDATLARDTVDRVRQTRDDAGLAYDAAYRQLARVVDEREARLRMNARAHWVEHLRRFAGETLDFADAIRRRGMARRVLDALAAAHISHATAARRMAQILARSKGAWLVDDASD